MNKIPLITAIALLLPLCAFADPAYQYQRGGIFDCNQFGGSSLPSSVGATSAIGGVFVPVADATVELNTGTLVYKECVLRPVVDAERQSALTGFLQVMYNNVMTARNGNPEYVTNPNRETLDVGDQELLVNLQNGTLNSANTALRQTISHAVAQEYEQETRNLNGSLTCPYSGDLNALYSGQSNAFSWTGLLDEGTPACDPIGAYYAADSIIGQRIALAVGYQQMQWNWGQGFYSLTDNAQDPLQRQILTPSSVITNSWETMLQSPVHQLETTNDIGQMIGALYAGVTTQVVGQNGGLPGLSQSSGGQAPYLSQVAQQAQADLTSNVTNAGLSVLNSALQIEQSYFDALKSISDTLSSAVNSLRGYESQCWTNIINSPSVCAGTTTATSCKDPAGDTLHIATSSKYAFAQAVITGQITPLSAPVSAAMASSSQVLQTLNTLAAQLSSSDPNTKNQALHTLDQMVTARPPVLHTSSDVLSAQSQAQNMQQQMQNVVSTAESTWSGTGSDGSQNLPWDGSVSPGSGWCNVNNSNTLSAWVAAWKQ